jgi:uncharacterized protein (DUF302 family)
LSTPRITSYTVEHVVVPSSQPFDELVVALERRLGLYGNWEMLPQQLASRKASWQEVTEATQALIGTSGFTIFVKMDQGTLLSLTGKPKRIIQYALGNHLLGVHMVEHIAEIGLYAPLRMLVYEDYEGGACIAYDRLSSLVSQYQNEEVIQVARLVDQKLEELAMQVTQPA